MARQSHGQLGGHGKLGPSLGVAIVHHGEQLVRHHPRAVGIHHLTDTGDTPHAVANLHMHHHVKGVGDEHVHDVDGQAGVRHADVRGQLRERRPGAVGVQRAHGAVVALAHGQHHGERLGATHLTDDHPIRVHAQGHACERRQIDRSATLDVGAPGLQRLVIGMQIGEPIDSQLVRVLDGDDALVDGDLVDQRAQQGGFSAAGTTHHDDVAARQHGRAQETRHVPTHETTAHQLLQGRQLELMLANHQRRFRGDVHHREQATSIG